MVLPRPDQNELESDATELVVLAVAFLSLQCLMFLQFETDGPKTLGCHERLITIPSQSKVISR